MISRSPDRNTFQMQAYIARCEEDNKTPNEDYLAMYQEENQQRAQQEQDPEWAKNNLEYDLRSTEWICAKARASEAYAQHIYAALCNQSWQKNDVWPRLQGEIWACTWRYAGGIVADMLGTGDYIDWYCSGIQGHNLSDVEKESMTEEEIQRYEWMSENFVGEGHVTDEIREDFFRLGWLPADDHDDI